MATIKKQFEDGMVDGWKSIILESDDEVSKLPISAIDNSKTPLQGYNYFAIGSEAFCPTSGNAFVLTKAGWIKL
jgi:hypothetical protein